MGDYTLMKVKFNIQTHSSDVSFDSTTPEKLMIRIYDRLNFDAIGFVGHNKFADVQSDKFIIFNGMEEEVSSDPEIHIVRFPEMGFSYLAHPRRITKENTKEKAEEVISNRNLNGVEKFSNGIKQYDGSINTIELANDDAHNIFQIGTSWMEAEVNDINRGQIVQAIKRNDFELKNKRRRFLGQGIKNINAGIGMLRNG